MAFSKRHYDEVARIIREHATMARDPSQEMTHAAVVMSMQDALRRMFAADNPRFDTTRFDMACEPKEGQR